MLCNEHLNKIKDDRGTAENVKGKMIGSVAKIGKHVL
jgi:hypothetical protein